MPDIVTKTVTTSYGQRVINSFKGVLGGLVFFFGSFALLYWNEGRVDLSKIAARALEIPAIITESAGEGQLISATGPVTITDKIGDSDFITPGSYLELSRKVEIYAWTEDEETETTTNSDGSETKTTTYTYQKEWTSNLEDSSSFAEPAGHLNPSDFTHKPGEWRVPALKVGEFTAKTSGLDLPSGQELSLAADILTPAATRAKQGDYLFFGQGTLSVPVVGDERLSYEALTPDFSGTIFGKRTSGSIGQFTDSDSNALFRLFAGDRAAAIATLHSEYLIMLWFLRFLGLIFMWAGLSSIMGPFSTIIDRFPFLGSIAKAGVGALAFIIALPLTIVTIIISAIAHSWLAILAVIALVGAWFYWSKKRASAA